MYKCERDRARSPTATYLLFFSAGHSVAVDLSLAMLAGFWLVVVILRLLQGELGCRVRRWARAEVVGDHAAQRQRFAVDGFTVESPCRPCRSEYSEQYLC